MTSFLPVRSAPGSSRGRIPSGPLRPGILTTALALATSGLLSAPVLAQEPAEPWLVGQVIRDGAPLEEGTVVLHRVAPDFAGEIDSTRVDAEGRFRFLLPRVPAPGVRSEVFFASVRHHEILYFGPPISEAVQLDSVYRVEVHDTTRAPEGGALLPVSVRNLFLERADDEGWTVTDLFEVRNEGSRTLVSAGGRSIWSHPLPPGSERIEVGQSDLSPDAVSFEGGRMRISAPIPPGERLYVIRYHLPDDEFSLPLEGRTQRMEVLVREPAPALTLQGLSPAQPVELEPGSTYRRWFGEDLQDVRIQAFRGQEDEGIPVEWLAVGLGLLLALAGIYAVRRSRTRPTSSLSPRREGAGPALTEGPASSPPGGGEGIQEEGPNRETRESLLMKIALLDEEIEEEGGEDAAPEAWARYREERQQLLQRLQEVEGGEGG